MQEAPRTPAMPEILAGKYRLVRQLGAGGMGSVWLADHLSLHCPVAIKLIDPEVAIDPRFRSRFMHEARAAAALRSPHVVQILDYGVDGATPYIAMELLVGESLADRLQRVGRLSPLETARVITHVGRAVSRAEEAGIVHRDLKPANVFLVQNDEEELAKVLDFGIAKQTTLEQGGSARPSTDSGVVLGTRCYMSPEQAGGAKTLDSRSDVWALGVIAFECLLGQRAFEGETVGAFLQALFGRPPPVPSACGAVPAGFDDWFARACAYEVSARFPSAREACAELRRICGAESTGEPRAPRGGAGPHDRSPGLAALPSALALLPTIAPPQEAQAAPAARPARGRPGRTAVVAIAFAALGALTVGAMGRARVRRPAPTVAPESAQIPRTPARPAATAAAAAAATASPASLPPIGTAPASTAPPSAPPEKAAPPAAAARPPHAPRGAATKRPSSKRAREPAGDRHPDGKPAPERAPDRSTDVNLGI